jgi:hypothetical protein
MASRLDVRLRRLETRRPHVKEERSMLPDFPAGWWREFWCVLREMGDPGVDIMVSLGLSRDQVEAVLSLPDEDFEAFVATVEETTTDARTS